MSDRSAGLGREETPIGDWWSADLHGQILLDVVRRRARGERRVILTHHLPALRAGRVRLQVLPIFVERAYLPDRALSRALEMIACLYRELDESRDAFVLVKSRADLRLVERSERVGFMLDLEGAEPLESDPANLLRLFYELGVRIVSLTWGRPTRFTATPESGEGLLRDGVALIRAMNELGIVLDVSHLPDSAFEAAVAFAQGAVVASNSSARALVDNPRNLTDAQLYAIGATGGLVGISFAPELVGEGGEAAIVRQIDYIGALIGRDKVALGPAYLDPIVERDGGEPDGNGPRPEPPALRFPALAHTLARSGFPPEAVRDVMGANALRFLRKVLT